MCNPRIIAYYLPQYHPIKENDLWWGEGFTEWYNVGKARPLFPGHSQPKVPTALGYYDLRVEEVREKQAEMARIAGIEGFCYWHYWFEKDHLLLEKPIESVLKSGRPDFPFCFGWANHSWEKKTWTAGQSNEILIEQKYGGIADYKSHFEYILPYFKDRRYIKVDGNPLFLIYAPLDNVEISTFIDLWNKWAKENGFRGVHFVAQANPFDETYDKYFRKGFDAVTSNGTGKMGAIKLYVNRSYKQALWYGLCKVLNLPRLVDYKNVINDMLDERDTREYVYPQIVCGWDHTPRSGKKGVVFLNFTPKLFRKHVRSVCLEVSHKKPEHQIVFLKSWNEWGEGNFMEPDLEYENGKIEAMREAIRDVQKCGKD